MTRLDKTVFISYRRTNLPWALAVYQNLTHHGFDVFFDFKGIASGDFEQVILGNIRARAHFIVLLTPSALERCVDQGDWLRREIETAVDLQRNVIPAMLEGFDFSSPAVVKQMVGSVGALRRYNGLDVPGGYFDEGMERLRTRYLNVSLGSVLHPVSAFVKQAAKEQQVAARSAPALAEGALTAQEWFDLGHKAAILSDWVKAERFYRKAAESGNAQAMNGLGTIYAIGAGGLPKDNLQATTWFRRAAGAGDAMAMSNLGDMYGSDSGGLPKNEVEALSWYRKSADAGNVHGMINLGMMYENGRGGLIKDPVQAMSLYRKAANLGDARGMVYLGTGYETGRGGLPKDRASAVSWYRKAAEAGDRFAKDLLRGMGEE